MGQKCETDADADCDSDYEDREGYKYSFYCHPTYKLCGKRIEHPDGEPGEGIQGKEATCNCQQGWRKVRDKRIVNSR